MKYIDELAVSLFDDSASTNRHLKINEIARPAITPLNNDISYLYCQSNPDYLTMSDNIYKNFMNTINYLSYHCCQV